MQQSLYRNIDVRVAKNTAQITATGNGEIIDTKGFESIVFAVQAGAVSAADGSNYLTADIYESDDSGMSGEEKATAILGEAPVINALTDADTVQIVGYNGVKRYLRLKFTETGTFDAVVGAVAILGDAHNKPVNAP